MTRILIADDQSLFLEMLCTIISSYKGYEIVARASNGHEAVELFMKHRPDVCLLDIQMPVCDGISALTQIKQLDSNAKVMMLTTFSEDENILDAFKAFADGYILKDVKPEVLINAIHCVCSGLACMNKRVLKILNDKILECESAALSSHHSELDIRFNPKDIEIIRLIGAGMSNKLIAEKLNYSEGTIRNRISTILNDTGLTDRTQIALFAIKNRLV